MSSEPSADKTRVPLLSLAAVFFRVGLTSFGGSTAAWLYREVVQKRGWLGEEGYLTALTFSQVLPGANPVNMSIYVGSMLRGGIGGVAAALGMVGPAFVVILILGYLYAQFGATPMSHAVLAGLAATGVGMTLSVGMKVAQKIRTLVPILFGIAVFVAVGILHWPTVPVVIVLAPLSVGTEYLSQAGRRADG
jgi:chromate transporter